MADPDPANDDEDDLILALWWAGFDTKLISEDMSIPEHEIARRLWRIREQRRQGGR